MLTGLVVQPSWFILGRLNVCFIVGPDDPSSAPLSNRRAVLTGDEPDIAEQQEAPKLYQEEAGEHQCKTGGTVEEANRLLLPHQVLD